MRSQARCSVKTGSIPYDGVADTTALCTVDYASLRRAPACHAGGRGCKSRLSPRRNRWFGVRNPADLAGSVSSNETIGSVGQRRQPTFCGRGAFFSAPSAYHLLTQRSRRADWVPQRQIKCLNPLYERGAVAWPATWGSRPTMPKTCRRAGEL